MEQDKRIKVGEALRNLAQGKKDGTVEDFTLYVDPVETVIEGTHYAKANGVRVRLSDGTQGAVLFEDQTEDGGDGV